jgi:ribonuclease PH
MKRIDGRNNSEIRPVSIILGYQEYPEGSVLIEMGKTKIICAVTVEDKVPGFIKGSGTGWVTAEYGMLPRATHTRNTRSVSSDTVSGRSREIQRLIGRSLRAAVDFKALGERTLIVDCDVLQADGGTRTAAITGGYVALYHALYKLKKFGVIGSIPIKNAVAATSVGILDREILLDLCYDEDYRASVDFNIVMTDKNEMVEIQGTAEGKPFSRETVDKILNLAEQGIKHLFEFQKEALKALD